MTTVDILLSQWTVGVAVLTAILVFYVKWSFSYLKNKNIPHLKPSFPWGNLENVLFTKKSQGFYLKDVYDKLKSQGAKYGGIYLFLSPIFMPIDPEYIKNILVKDFNSFHERGFYSNERDQPMSANLFTIDGAKWKILRGRYTSAFTSAKIKSMFHTMAECTVAMNKAVAKFAENKQPISAKYITARYTTDIIGSCAFGVECNSFENDNTFLEHTEKCVEESTKLVRFAFLNAFPNVSRFLKLGLFTNEALMYFADLIVDTLQYREKNSLRRQDFLQIMKDMKDKKNNENYDLSLDEIQAQSFLFFLAGYETTATTLMYVLFELGKNQDIQDKVRSEIREFLKNNSEISFDNIGKMSYMQAVVDEALRLYSPFSYLNRKCVEDYKIPGSEHILEKGTNIVIPVLALHRDPEFYPNPEVFDPDRFSEENKAKRNPYVYLPFGEGPRNCLGSRFALLELKVGLFHLLNKFKFALSKNTKRNLEFTNHFILTPDEDIQLEVEAL